ncbi:hypothetical protein PO407_25215, partial [Escherichia coli]
ADRNRSHWSTSKTPSYTKSVSWQHHLLRDAHLFGQDLISGSGKSGLYFWPVLLFTLFQRSTVDIETPQNSATCFVVIKLFIAAPPAIVQLKDSCACA